MKKLIRPLIIIAVIVLVAAGVGMRLSKNLHKKPTPPRTVAAHRGDITVKVTETGTIEPVNKVDVKSKVAGRLLEIPVQEGEYVKAGQLIATVDTSLIAPQIKSSQAQLAQGEAKLAQTIATYDLQAKQDQMAIAQAQANLLGAETHVEAVKAGSRPQELAQQEEAVDRAKISLADALRTQKRKAALLEKGFIAQSDVDAAQLAVDTAQSNLDSAQQQLSLLQAGPKVQDINDAEAQAAEARVQLATAEVNAEQNKVRKFDIDQSRASVEQTQNDLGVLMVNLHDTRILAPTSGIVLKKYKEVNEIVQSATTGFSDSEAIVVTLGNQPQVRVGINEVDIDKVRLGAPVEIHVDALPDTVFHGKVTGIAPASTNAFDSTGTSATGSGTSSIAKFSVKIAFDRDDPNLRPGMSANINIISAKHHNVLLAPLEGIPFTEPTGTVQVLTASGKIEPRKITTGLRDDTQAEILSGLSAGDKLVVPKPVGRRTIDINGGNGDDGN